MNTHVSSEGSPAEEIFLGLVGPSVAQELQEEPLRCVAWTSP
jgi:hypothetical protein